MTTLTWCLLGLQVMLGIIDTIVHHELLANLSWRHEHQRELALHGARNAVYGVIFLVLAWTTPTGWYVWVLASLLAVEFVLTLADFVEEDRQRDLPPSERVIHTVMAVVFGMFFASLLPVLTTWFVLPSALTIVSHSWWSYGATAAAAGIGVFALKDLLNAGRLIVDNARGALVAGLKPGTRVLLAGGTGLVGSRLVEALVEAGHDVTVWTRNPRAALRLPTPVRLVEKLDMLPVHSGFDVIVNLAGASVAAGWWTTRRRQLILESRTQTWAALGALASRLDSKPDLFISASAVGWYGVEKRGVVDEQSGAGAGFAAQVCRSLEAAAQQAAPPATRVIHLRIGVVLAARGGTLAQLLLPFQLGLGGRLGSGQQPFSWIELDDLVRLVAWVIQSPGISGPVNATAPNPVDNRALTHSLAQALGIPAVFPLPAWIIRLALGQMGEELLLRGQRVRPSVALAGGFEFAFPDIDSGLRHALLR